MQRDVPLVSGETYHIFNRGAHKQRIFIDESDYRRFLLTMYLANHSEPVSVRNVVCSKKYREPFSEFATDKSLVHVLAYALMPNHFHMIVRQQSEGGISKFAKKLFVGYSMYFNIRREHSGVLFQGRFQSRHIDSEDYFRWSFSYVHLNPLELKFSDWQSVGILDVGAARSFMDGYQHSSYLDYRGANRPQRSILSLDAAPPFLYEQDDVADLLATFTENRPR